MMTDDATFERDLRAMLAARDPGAAPVALASTVRARVGSDGVRARFDGPRRVLNAVAIMAAAAAVLVLAIVVARPPATGPGGSPAPEATGPYVVQPGDGVIGGEDLPRIQAVLAMLASVALITIAVRTSDRRIRVAAILGSLAIVLVAATIGTSDAIGFRDGAYGVQPGRNGPEGDPGMYVAVTGNSPFTLLLTVTNTSRLPLEITGIPADGAEGAEPPSPHLPRFVGLGLLPDDVVDSSAVGPFHPVSLPPAGSVNLAFLGLAGDCAVLSPGPDGQAGYQIATVRLVYEQLTIRHVADIVLPQPVIITIPGQCP
jgi:hypothetical protein